MLAEVARFQCPC